LGWNNVRVSRRTWAIRLDGWIEDITAWLGAIEAFGRRLETP
jgi:hypothetical protein